MDAKPLLLRPNIRDIQLSNILQTTKILIARPLPGDPECARFRSSHCLYSNHYCHTPNIAAKGIIIIFSYDAVSGRDSNQ